MIYFDNAATTFPKPRAVGEAVTQAMRLYGANPGRSGHQMAVKTAEQVYACRERAAQLFGCQPEQVVFTQNCTHAINMAIKGVAQPGDHFIISDLEHNAVARTVHQLYLDGIASYTIAATGPTEETTLASFAQALRPNTKMICCTHGSNVFGNILPVAKIGGLARANNVLMLVDAAQTAGVLDIDVVRDNIDFLCMPGHKSLYGPSGTGMLIINCQEPLHTLMEGGTGSASLELAMPDFLPDRLESGTINTTGIIGLKSGMGYVMRHGTKKLYTHEMSLAQAIYRQLSPNPQVHFYGPPPTMGQTLPVLAFTVGRLDGMETSELLSRHGIATRGGFHCAKLAHEKMGTNEIGVARVSIGGFNTMEHVNYLCNTVKKYCKSVE